MVELLIQNGSNVFFPIVEDNIQLEYERKGSPGKLTFNVVKDSTVNFTEGNAVRLTVDGKKMFYGFVFAKSRGKDGIIKVTAYDQLRYFKNKDTYVYSGKTASEVLKMVAADFRLRIGQIADTKFKIESRVEDNQTLFDVVQNALDLTLMANKELFVLYDGFGELNLKNINDMKLNLVIDAETGENFSYTSSMDSQTYNKIKLAYDNEKTGKRDVYIAQDSKNMNSWGVLQYFEKIDEKTNGKAKADALLSLYNKKTRSLTISDAFGDVRVIGGSMVVVKLDLGDVTVGNYMVVESVKHLFKKEEHTMNLKLKGGVVNE